MYSSGWLSRGHLSVRNVTAVTYLEMLGDHKLERGGCYDVCVYAVSAIIVADL